MAGVGDSRRLCAIAAVIAVLAAGYGCGDTDAASRPSVGEDADAVRASPAREDALVRARVWRQPPVPAAQVDFSRNTPGPGAFDAGADVDCEFRIEPVGGSTPKFVCSLPGGDKIKVKYGVPNGELPAEVAATRLLAALGFPTDRMYRVRSVRCRGCPLLPQQALQCLEQGHPSAVCLQGAAHDHVVTFAPAVIERPLDGTKIESGTAHGWSWYELGKIDAKAGGSSRAEIDALRLMAVLLAHWDNKDANQKLLCPEKALDANGRCRAPIAAIGDLGSTFGPRKVDLPNWRRVAVWADARTCRVSMSSLPFAGATFPDVQISEGGRQFALTLLHGLTRRQLDTLFEASGMTSFPHVVAAAHQPSAWTDAFLAKVRELERGGPCPTL
jgi:hypothetical protein